MKYSVAAVLALAATAFAAPTPGGYEEPCHDCDDNRNHYPTPHHGHGHGHCENPTFVDNALLVLDVNIDVELEVLGILEVDAEVDVDLTVALGRARKHYPQCKAIYCCPSRCERNKHVPKECRLYA